jgi:hypothetical protein
MIRCASAASSANEMLSGNGHVSVRLNRLQRVCMCLTKRRFGRAYRRFRYAARTQADAQKQKHADGTCQCKGEHARALAMEERLHCRLQRRRDETAEIAERADHRNTARCRGTAQVGRRQGPEERLNDNKADRRDTERDEHGSDVITKGR